MSVISLYIPNQPSVMVGEREVDKKSRKPTFPIYRPPNAIDGGVRKMTNSAIANVRDTIWMSRDLNVFF